MSPWASDLTAPYALTAAKLVLVEMRMFRYGGKGQMERQLAVSHEPGEPGCSPIMDVNAASPRRSGRDGAIFVKRPKECAINTNERDWGNFYFESFLLSV